MELMTDLTGGSAIFSPPDIFSASPSSLPPSLHPTSSVSLLLLTLFLSSSPPVRLLFPIPYVLYIDIFFLLFILTLLFSVRGGRLRFLSCPSMPE